MRRDGARPVSPHNQLVFLNYDNYFSPKNGYP